MIFVGVSALLSGPIEHSGMINWIDILSPALRQLHKDWVYFRGASLMPSVSQYNHFINSPTVKEAHSVTATVLLPADEPAVFRHIGPKLAGLFPGCRAGMKFTEFQSSITRAALTRSFLRVAASRQPEARRTRDDLTTAAKSDHEILLLPFSDNKLQVRIVHAIYDLGGIDWKRAFT